MTKDEAIEVLRGAIKGVLQEIPLRDSKSRTCAAHLQLTLDATAKIAAPTSEAVAWMTPNDWGNEPLTTSVPSVVSAWRSDNRVVTELYVTTQPAADPASVPAQIK